MKDFFKKIWSAKIAGSFLTGLFVLLPVVLTFVILNWVLDKVSGILGPNTLIGNLLSFGGSTLVGPGHTALSFIVGLMFAFIGIWGIGLLAKSLARNQLSKGVDLIFERLPIVRSIYKPINQVVRLFNREGNDELKGMSVVTCRFGGENGADILALMPTQKTYDINGEQRVMVYLPTSPLPMSGALVLMNENNIVPMPDISVDEIMQIYFSMGIIIPETLLSPGKKHTGKAFSDK